MRYSRARLLAFGPLLLLPLAWGHDARACGGTFCDSGPKAMPVDQRGENILFVMQPGKVEAHIQIQYNGDAARFAWVLPVPALPEVEVGSQALFQNLLSGTVPRFGLTPVNDCGFGNQGQNASQPKGAGPVAIDGGGGGTTVVLQKAVGSFEVTVLQGGSAVEITDWLTANGYALPPTTADLLQSYVAQKFLFVAVKLTGGAGIDEIHPLVVRYAGSEPCVPLKLTAVGAVEDMGVRTFFLGTHRMVPKNYKHVVLNPLMINWLNLATNYEEVIAGAADSPVANGHAFVTEYAGATSVVNTFGLVSQQWNANVFVGADPLNVMTLLQQQGLVTSCGGGTCTYSHPLILPLLRTYLPAPAGVDEGGFYACLRCYADATDREAWGDGTAFARALEERVIVPGRHASDVILANPYLTRMYTTISPAEMTEDPTFEERTGLPDVAFTKFATQRTRCDGKSGVILPDGREVGLLRVDNPASASAMTVSWPTFTSEMPWVEHVEDLSSASAAQVPATSDGGAAPLVLVDNSQKIDELLKAWNDSIAWVPGGLDGGAAPGDLEAGAGSGEAGVDSGAGLTAGNSTGCSCDIPGRASRGVVSLGWYAAGLCAVALRKRPRTKDR